LIRSSWPSSFAAGRDRRSTWGPQRLPLSLCCQFMRDLCCQVAKQPGSHAAADSVVAPSTHLRRCYEVVPRRGCTPCSPGVVTPEPVVGNAHPFSITVGSISPMQLGQWDFGFFIFSWSLQPLCIICESRSHLLLLRNAHP